jgi:allophanate hydrolase subunit 2
MGHDILGMSKTVPERFKLLDDALRGALGIEPEEPEDLREEAGMNIANEEVKELIAEIPEDHKHLRTTIALHDGRSFTFQEALIASLVRAYITVTTHLQRTTVRLSGRRLDVRKEGCSEWQLVEE